MGPISSVAFSATPKAISQGRRFLNGTFVSEPDSPVSGISASRGVSEQPRDHGSHVLPIFGLLRELPFSRFSQ